MAKNKRTLIIAEKPGVARDIANVLGRFIQKKGYLESDSYFICWAVGHLAELASPEDYDPSLKKWAFDTLPIIPASFFIKPLESKSDQLKVLKTLLNRSDVHEVVNACDAGREGELIFRYIYHLAICRKPVKRLWLSENTPQAISKAFENLDNSKRFDFLFASAQARARADWLIGINSTRAYTVYKKEKLTIGRVQTPTLALLVEREEKIRAFVPKIYWELWLSFETEKGDQYRGRWFDENGTSFSSLDAANAVLAMVRKKSGSVFHIDVKDSVVKAPLLYNLDDLQQDANRYYGMTAARTLEVAQVLYEKRKLITYPRTDSRFVTEILADATFSRRIDALCRSDTYSTYAYKAAGCPLPDAIVNDAGVTDHHAILPTEVVPNFSLSGEERDIYDLVARRFIAVFFPPAEYKNTSLITKVNGHSFQSKDFRLVNPGWKEVYSANSFSNVEESEIQNRLPELHEGTEVSVASAEIQEKSTKPPGRYTDAALIKAMRNAGNGSGLGTPATRAGIIEKLISVGYIERRGKHLVPTMKGEELINIIPEELNELKSPHLTALWEEKLNEIAMGKYDAKKFMAGIEEIVSRVIVTIGARMGS